MVILCYFGGCIASDFEVIDGGPLGPFPLVVENEWKNPNQNRVNVRKRFLQYWIKSLW